MLTPQKKVQGIKYWLRGTFVLLVIFALILLSCYGIAFKGSEDARKIFWIVFASVCGALLLAYWIYAFIHDSKIRKELSSGTENSNSAKGAKK